MLQKGQIKGRREHYTRPQDHLHPFKISSILQTKKRHETRLKSCLSSAPPPRKNPGSTLSNLFYGIELAPTLIAFNCVQQHQYFEWSFPHSKWHISRESSYVSFPYFFPFFILASTRPRTFTCTSKHLWKYLIFFYMLFCIIGSPVKGSSFL